MLQVEQLTARLEKLLEGPSVSPSVGQRAVAVVSELMEGDALALSPSASRWRQCHPRNTHTHRLRHRLDVSKCFYVLRLIRAVDDLGVKLLVTADVEVVSSKSLALAVKKVHGDNFPQTFVYILNMERIQVTWCQHFPRIHLNEGLSRLFAPPVPVLQQVLVRFFCSGLSVPALLSDCRPQRPTAAAG